MSAIDDKTQETLRQIGSADIIIGIPSYNNADTIGHVIKAADLGHAKYFSGHKCVILISEGGNVEETERVVSDLKIRKHFESSFISRPKPESEILVTKYQGTSGKGTAIKAIFEAGEMLEVKAGCMLDSDLRSISPEWIELLIAPVILKDFGFVTPYYSRHKYDGTITNMIAYPVTWSLYGRRVRQPIGGDFGFSIDLIKSLLSKDVWETDIARFGIDIWMTTLAICENFKICQSFLGSKIHDDKDPGKDLSPMFKQVVGTIFGLMDLYADKWLEIKGSRPTAIFGFNSESSPKPIHVDITHMVNKFKEDVPKYMHIWEQVLDPENCKKIMEVAKMEETHFELPIELWVKSLFDFAAAYRLKTNGLKPGEVIEALVPLYYAKTASFVRKTQNLDTQQAEGVINEQCEVFEKMKPYLVNLWTSK
jgi:glycosyltransferase involved in cell wall biosynthesis